MWYRVQFNERDTLGDQLHKGIVQSVLRKLVKERAKLIEGLSIGVALGAEATNRFQLEALRDFGIDEETWKHGDK